MRRHGILVAPLNDVAVVPSNQDLETIIQLKPSQIEFHQPRPTPGSSARRTKTHKKQLSVKTKEYQHFMQLHQEMNQKSVDTALLQQKLSLIDESIEQEDPQQLLQLLSMGCLIDEKERGGDNIGEAKKSALTTTSKQKELNEMKLQINRILQD